MVQDFTSAPALHIVKETFFFFSEKYPLQMNAFIYSLLNLKEMKTSKYLCITLLPHNSSSLCGCYLEADKQ